MTMESDYFSTPQLNGLLQQMRHLCVFGADALVVEAESGAGKSSLANRLADQLRAESLDGTHIQIVLACLFEGDGIDVVLSDICNQLGLWVGKHPGHEIEAPGECMSQLRALSQNLIREKRLGLILIDDAHFMSDQLLGAFLSLLEGDTERPFGFRFIFLGQPGIASRIDEIAPVDITVYDFVLPEFSSAELKSFVLSRYPSYDEDSDKFELPSLHSLWSLSGGNPGAALNIIASQRQIPEKNIHLHDFKRIPVAHIGLASALVAMLALVLLYGGESEQDAVEGEIPFAEAEMPAASTLPEATDTPNFAEVAAQSDPEHIIPTQPPSLIDASSEPSLEKVTIAAGETSAEPKQNDIDAHEALSLGATGVARDAPVVAEVEKQAEKPIDSDSTASLATADIAETTLSRVDLPEDEQAVAGPVKNDETQGLAAIVMSPDEEELMKRDTSRYVLQLAAATQRDRLDGFVKSQPNTESLRIYRRRRNGEDPWYIVVQGNYRTKQLAVSAIATLPEQQRSAKPWPKSADAVKKEIQAFLRN